jgi:protein-S-isoprenylcysteine O-methyltransferase Ste14
MEMKSFRERLFSFRSYTPLPFLLVMVAFARPTPAAFASGVVVMALGELLRFVGVAYAGPLTRVTGEVGAPELIVAGPFAFVRNPLYVGNMFLYIGVGIAANALAPWLVLGAAVYFFFQYTMIVSLEEEFLDKKFGEVYRVYRSKVPRFLPRLVPFRTPTQETQRPDWKAAVKSEKRTFQAIVLILVLLAVRWWIGPL